MSPPQKDASKRQRAAKSIRNKRSRVIQIKRELPDSEEDQQQQPSPPPLPSPPPPRRKRSRAVTPSSSESDDSSHIRHDQHQNIFTAKIKTDHLSTTLNGLRYITTMKIEKTVGGQPIFCGHKLFEAGSYGALIRIVLSPFQFLGIKKCAPKSLLDLNERGVFEGKFFQYAPDRVGELFNSLNGDPLRTPGSTHDLFVETLKILNSQWGNNLKSIMITFITVEWGMVNLLMDRNQSITVVTYANVINVLLMLTMELESFDSLSLDFYEMVYRHIGLGELWNFKKPYPAAPIHPSLIQVLGSDLHKDLSEYGRQKGINYHQIFDGHRWGALQRGTKSTASKGPQQSSDLRLQRTQMAHNFIQTHNILAYLLGHRNNIPFKNFTPAKGITDIIEKVVKPMQRNLNHNGLKIFFGKSDAHPLQKLLSDSLAYNCAPPGRKPIDGQINNKLNELNLSSLKPQNRYSGISSNQFAKICGFQTRKDEEDDRYQTSDEDETQTDDILASSESPSSWNDFNVKEEMEIDAPPLLEIPFDQLQKSEVVAE